MRNTNSFLASGPSQLSILAGIALICGLAIWSSGAPVTEFTIGSYATALRGRTSSQIHNVRLATATINNIVIPPGGVFSFLRAVGPWTADRGYVRAPVSYDGELVRNWGGGVCQASSTLYNAALLAGLEIIERHRHHWPARYAPLGRDAAVAYSDIDLRFRNNLPKPIRIVGSIEGEKLVFRIISTYRPDYSIRVESRVRSVNRPTEVVHDRSGSGYGRWKLVNRGHPGFHVVTYRRFLTHDASRTEIVSEDRYPPLHRVIVAAER
ncbi:MAG: VanW family protein [Armatimonadetes bacterium]|nr:VanW family protein [Armatimonadota bacterium]